MSRLIPSFAAALCLLFTVQGSRLAAQYCNMQTTIQNLLVQYVDLMSGCGLEVGPTWEYKATKQNRGREFTFSHDGQVMIFVNTKDSEYLSRATGARCFQILPFRTPVPPSFMNLGNGTVQLTTPAAHKAVFSAETGEPVSIEGVKLTLQPLAHMTVTEKNAGFVTLKADKGFILFDFGWRTGDAPMSQLWRDVTICDGEGNTCKVKMKELFYVPDPIDANSFPTITNNEQLKAFLAKRCPKIVMPQ